MTGASGAPSVSGVTPCRPATADEMPGHSGRLVDYATRGGWDVAATFAAAALEGHDEPTCSTVVRCRHRDGRRVVAWWTNGTPDGAAFALGGTWWTFTSIPRALGLVRPVTRPKRYVPADPYELDDESDELGPDEPQDAP